MSGKVEHLHQQLPAAVPTPSEPVTTLTNSQVALSLYFMLRANGQELRGAVDLADIARYMHLLTGKKYTSIHNSSLYKRLQTVPESKGTQSMRKDLQLLHALFTQVELDEVAQLIQEVIDTIMNS